MGCDGIPPLILKHAATALVDPIHYLFNLCISQSYLPSEWCSHLITLIPKSGDRSNIENYWHISLLCSISKVLEKIIFDKVSDFILNHTLTFPVWLHQKTVNCPATPFILWAPFQWTPQASSSWCRLSRYPQGVWHCSTRYTS